MSDTILITSALPYVNNIPHLGNIIGCVLPGDVIARYHRLRGHKVLYVCGADEYGTATEVKAREEGVTPRELCDKYYAKHKEIYDWFNIKFDIWGRTSTPNPRTDDWFHTKISQDIFSKLYKAGFLEEREVVQLFCPAINRFVADRFIVGTCPKCSDTKARGDQCDKCQAVYESTELIEPRLKVGVEHSFIPNSSSATSEDSTLEPRTSRHLFLRLDLLQPQIERWFEGVKHTWPSNVCSVTRSWLEKGLKPRCITRDMEWGTPLPKGISSGSKSEIQESSNFNPWASKVMYNRFDAPIGYISISGESNLDLWQDPNTRLIQFMGIDNVPFHSILFPASLMGSGDNYTLVSELVNCRYLNFEGGKFSKTDNRGIFGDEVMKKGIPADYWRYYLMKIRPEDGVGPNGSQRGDANFTWSGFVNTCNADLVKNYGNLVHRVCDLTHKYCGGSVDTSNVDKVFSSRRYDIILKCNSAYESNLISQAIHCALELSTLTNKYLTETAPWSLYKQDPNDPNIITAVTTALLSVITVTEMLQPVIPETSETIMSYFDKAGFIIKVNPKFHPFFSPIKLKN